MHQGGFAQHLWITDLLEGECATLYLMMSQLERERRYDLIMSLHKMEYSNQEVGDTLGLTNQRISQIIRAGKPVEIEIIRNPLWDRVGRDLGGRERTRTMARYRDNFTCQDCGLVRTPEEVSEHNSRLTSRKGRIKNLDVHHLNDLCGKKSKGYDKIEDVDGLITLCHKCHYNRPEHSFQKRKLEKASG